MQLKFSKYQGLGNDFIIIQEFHCPPDINFQKLAKNLCDRHWSIGADGLIILKQESKTADFTWEYINSDGSYAEMCGNGMRCFAKYIYDNNFINKQEFKVQTKLRIVDCTVIDKNHIKVDMGQPLVDFLNKEIQVLDKRFKINAISMGNPHAVIFLEGIVYSQFQDFDVQKYGSALENNTELFPNKTNVEFIYIEDKQIHLRVWERGCGETLACGTGACASVVATILNKKASKNKDISVLLKGGELKILWGDNNYIYMTGETKKVFQGIIEI